MARALAFAVPRAVEETQLPDGQMVVGCRMVFSDGQQDIAHLDGPRSFRRIERHGVWYRLGGRDRLTGELVYLPE